MAYTASATTVGGRNGHVESADGLIKLDLSVPKSIGGPGKPNTSNPEELFAAGYSACFGGAVEYAARLEKVHAGPVTSTAEVTIDQNGDLDRQSFMGEVVNGKQVITEVLPKLAS